MESIGADLSHPIRLPTSTSPKAESSSSSKEDDRCSQLSTSSPLDSVALSAGSFVAGTSQAGELATHLASTAQGADPVFLDSFHTERTSDAVGARGASPLSGNTQVTAEHPLQLGVTVGGSSQPAPVAGTAGLQDFQVLSRRERFVASMTNLAEQASDSDVASLASEASVAAEMVLEAGLSISETLNISTTAAMVGGAVGYGLLGLGGAAIGGYQIGQGLKNHDKESVAEGISNTLGGISSSAASVSFAGVGAAGVKSAVSSVAGKLIAPFAVASGAIDAGLGIKELSDGIKEKSAHKITSGALGAAFGIAMVASALGGGIPALVAAGVCWAAQIGVDFIASHHQ